MVAATYTSDLTDIFMFESTTNVNAYGGGGAGLGAGPDYAVEGTNAVDKQVSASEKGFLYASGAAFTIGADDHFFIWANVAVYGLADTRNNRGIVVNVGDDTSNFVKFHVAGSDTLPLGGANPYAVRFVNTALTNLRTLVGTPGTAPTDIGVGANITGTARFANLGGDAARIGTGYDILNGTGADPEADFAGIAADDVSTAEGVLQPTKGGYLLQGKLRIGSGATACEFLDSNTNIFIVDTIHSLADFTEILVENASSIVTLSNVNFVALGTNNPGRFEMLTSTATVVFTNVGFIDFGATVLGTDATMTGCRWIGSGIITANGAAILSGSSISGYEGTADTSPLVWNVAIDPDGKLDDMTVIKGTAATHAIEFGVTSPLTMTMRGMTSTGYNAANGNNDSTFHVKRTSGTVTINVIGGTGNFSYKSDGATVVIVIDPVDTLVTVKDARDNSIVTGARVLLEARDGTGDLDFEESVTITRVTTVATVAHTAHPYIVGNKVNIQGANQPEYNGPQTITAVLTNSYDFTVAGSPTTPATGTITSNGVVLEGTTDGSGEIKDTRTWTSPQPVRGVARKSSASPFFKSSPPIADTIAIATGLSLTVQLNLDE